MNNVRNYQKVIAILAASVALTVPLTAYNAAQPNPFNESAAGRTVAVGDEAAGCTHVDAPMVDIPTASDTEPRMRIPQPPGWRPITDLGDVAAARFAMVNGDPAAYPRKVVAVALHRVPDASDAEAQVMFDATRAELVEMFAKRGWPTELTAKETTVCGLPAETVTYAGDPALNAHSVAMLWVAVETEGDTYLAMVSQDFEPQDPSYQRGAETILSGFQLLPPAAGQRPWPSARARHQPVPGERPPTHEHKTEHHESAQP